MRYGPSRIMCCIVCLLTVPISVQMPTHRQILDHGLSQYLETGCPNRGFIDFYVSKVWYKVHTSTTNKINHKYLQILLF